MSLFSPTADVSVRPAVSGDEDAVAHIQLSAWSATHTDVLTEDVLDKLDADRIRTQWRDAIMSPPGPGFAVLVACSGPHVVGFCAVAPAQLVSLEVLPEHRRGGHGSRLLMAGVDRLRSDGAVEVVTWCFRVVRCHTTMLDQTFRRRKPGRPDQRLSPPGVAAARRRRSRLFAK